MSCDRGKHWYVRPCMHMAHTAHQGQLHCRAWVQAGCSPDVLHAVDGPGVGVGRPASHLHTRMHSADARASVCALVRVFVCMLSYKYACVCMGICVSAHECALSAVFRSVGHLGVPLQYGSKISVSARSSTCSPSSCHILSWTTFVAPDLYWDIAINWKASSHTAKTQTAPSHTAKTQTAPSHTAKYQTASSHTVKHQTAPSHTAKYLTASPQTVKHQTPSSHTNVMTGDAAGKASLTSSNLASLARP